MNNIQNYNIKFKTANGSVEPTHTGTFYFKIIDAYGKHCIIKQQARCIPNCTPLLSVQTLCNCTNNKCKFELTVSNTHINSKFYVEDIHGEKREIISKTHNSKTIPLIEIEPMILIKSELTNEITNQIASETNDENDDNFENTEYVFLTNTNENIIEEHSNDNLNYNKARERADTIRIHNSLGHHGAKRIIDSFKQKFITGRLPNNFSNHLVQHDCTNCSIASNRSSDTNKGKQKQPTTNECFQLLHMDILDIGLHEQLPPLSHYTLLHKALHKSMLQNSEFSYNNERDKTLKKVHVLIVVDDYSRFTWVLPIQNPPTKQNIFKAFNQGILTRAISEHTQVRVQNNKPIEIKIGSVGIKSDDDPRFNEIKEYCDKNNIAYRTSPPFVQNYNGIAEAAINQLKMSARRLMLQSLLPANAYVYALQYAAFVKNIVATTSHQITFSPHVRMFGKPFPLQRLHVFGAPCYYLDNTGSQKPRANNNLSSKKTTNDTGVNLIKRYPAIFLGYVHNAYHTSSFLTIGFRRKSIKETLQYATEMSENKFDIVFDDFAMNNIETNKQEYDKFVTSINDIEINEKLVPAEIHLKENEIDTNYTVPNLNDEEHYTSGAIEYAFSVQNILLEDFDETYKIREINEVPPLEWMEAIEKEWNGVLDKGTLKLVDFESHMKPIPTRWVLKVRNNNTLKARLVAQGFRQKQGINYFETFSSVVTKYAFNIFISFAVYFGLDLYSADFEQAYIQSKPDSEVYVKPPFTHKLPPGKIFKVERSLYGLKQSGRMWFIELTSYITDVVGLQQLSKDSCFFVKFDEQQNIQLLVVVLVDDIGIAGSEQDYTIFINKLKEKYALSQQGVLTSFNGIEIIRKDKHYIELSQTVSLRRFLKQYKTSNKHYETPLPAKGNYKLQQEKTDESCSEQEYKEYRSILGGLIWFAASTRPDI